MKILTIIAYLGGFVGILAHIPLYRDIKNGVKGYSFASFLLWGLLDSIATYNLFILGENYILSISYATCALLIASLLLYKKKIDWSWVETMVLALICICLLVWYMYGSYVSFVLTIISLFIASTPQIKDSIKEPSLKVGRVYIIFIVANIISCFASLDGNFKSLAYPLSAVIICGLIIIFSYQIVSTQRFFKKT